MQQPLQPLPALQPPALKRALNRLLPQSLLSAKGWLVEELEERLDVRHLSNDRELAPFTTPPFQTVTRF